MAVVILLVRPSQTLIFVVQRDCTLVMLDAGMASTAKREVEGGN